MEYDFKKIKKQVQAESELYVRFGPGRIFSFLLSEIFGNDTNSVIQFMISEAGGFTAKEVDRIFKQKQNHQDNYKYRIESY